MLAVAFYAIPGLSGSIAIQEAAINRTIIDYELNGQASQFVIDLDAYDPHDSHRLHRLPRHSRRRERPAVLQHPRQRQRIRRGRLRLHRRPRRHRHLRRDDLGVLARLLTAYQRILGTRSASPLETHLAEHLASAFPLSSTAPGTTSPQLRFLIRRRQHLSRFRGVPLSVAQCTFNFGNCKSPDHSHGISWSSESA